MGIIKDDVKDENLEQTKDNFSGPANISELIGKGSVIKKTGKRLSLLLRSEKEFSPEGGDDDSYQIRRWVSDMSEGNDERDMESRRLDAGKRPEGWYERVSEKADQNAARSRENTRLLLKLDYRTSWIFRILLTFMAGLLLAGYSQIIGL